MAQNLALAVAVQRQKVQESSGTPTGGVGASMRGYVPTASRVGGGCSDQYLQHSGTNRCYCSTNATLAQFLCNDPGVGGERASLSITLQLAGSLPVIQGHYTSLRTSQNNHILAGRHMRTCTPETTSRTASADWWWMCTHAPPAAQIAAASTCAHMPWSLLGSYPHALQAGDAPALHERQYALHRGLAASLMNVARRGHTCEGAAQLARMMEEHMSPGMTSKTDPGCRRRQLLSMVYTCSLVHDLECLHDGKTARSARQISPCFVQYRTSS